MSISFKMHIKQRSCKTDHTSCMGRIYGSGRRHSAHDRKQTDLPVKKRNHRADLRYSERTAWISIYTVCRKSTDGNESRAYLCMHEFEKTGKDPGKTRLEHSQIFVDFEENKKKSSFKRKMVLGIIPNTKFVYSLRGASSGSSNVHYFKKLLLCSSACRLYPSVARCATFSATRLMSVDIVLAICSAVYPYS